MTEHERAAATGSGGTGTAHGQRPESGPGPADGPRPLRRERRHRMIAGVCAGLGRDTGMDPVIFRITLAVLAATGGIGLLFYGFAWLFVPYEDEEENEIRRLLTGRVDGPALAAVLFALVGCGTFLTMLRNGGVLTFAAVLSLLLAGAGYWSRQRGASDADPLAERTAADAPPEAQAPPAAAYPSWWRDPIVKDGTHVGGTGYLWGPPGAREPRTSLDIGMALPWTHPGAATPPSAPPHRPRGPRWTGGWIFLLALVAGGLGTGLTWDTRPLGVSLQLGLACALGVFGLGIALSSWLGRTGAGSVFWAIVTAALLTGASVLPHDISTQWRDEVWRPAAQAELRPHYDVGTGRGTLDLSGIRPGAGRTVTTDAEVGAGQLRVTVPADTRVRLRIEVGLGDIRLPGDDSRDVDVRPAQHQRLTLVPAKGAPGERDTGTLEIALRVGVGQVEVSRAAS
ncbi:PspC domain-containing protein [Streptomyces sp. J2-1]|uniref:PspC domain-containing protein n=1 Tax=Streptomyces corallincola TaxID=2851888 RepID=UPI001C3855F0|nr:PspC domain-containing protein [Streptomyces corallincola]MBV2355769.1 PspC domain-containing protein [Streptomyces corallincola]